MRRPALPFIIIGGAAAAAGGLISAATAIMPSYTASWAVAYTVLVVGVAQVILGVGQSTLATAPPTVRAIVSEAVIFNLGNLGVLAGTVFGQPVVVYVGAALIVAALVLFLFTVRGSGKQHSALHWGYRLLVMILLVSIPVGLVIASLRPA